jgi:hypothetical protein
MFKRFFSENKDAITNRKGGAGPLSIALRIPNTDQVRFSVPPIPGFSDIILLKYFTQLNLGG